MSDYIPFEIEAEIMKRLPVKSLIQFRSVSKPWKSLIDSSEFIKRYSGQPTNQKHLFLIYYVCLDDRYVSIADDHTFPHQKHHLNFPQWLVDYDYDLIGCSHGLLCLSYGEDATEIAIIWNFLIRKAVALVLPNAVNEIMLETVLGFGVCRETTDPKIVKITPISQSATESIISCIHWQVEVFTLSTGVWRSAYGNPPHKPIRFDRDQVVIDGIIYRLAGDRINLEVGRCMYYNLIISFDLTSEEFTEINLPDSLHQFGFSLSISKLRESLVVVEPVVKVNGYVVGIWMMEDGVSNVFTKLFNVNVSTPSAKVKGFRKSGEPVIGISKDSSHKVVVYEPHSKHSDNVVIDHIEASYYLSPYMESLLLLNESDLTVHKEMETLKFEDDFLLEPSFSYWFNGKSEDDFPL